MHNSITGKDRIAIVGVGLSFPGGAEDAEGFWDLLANKTDATIDIPKDRWDINRFYAPFESDKPGKMYVKRGGFLNRAVDTFDPLFFGISPREAAIMDYQQRLLLETSAKTLQDASYTEEKYRNKNIGVFVGGFCMDAHVQAASQDNRNWYITQSVTGSTATMLSNRISYIFDLKGPSLTIDTACSSSLVAAHYASQSILRGECDSALVGGVNIMTQPEHFIEMCKGRLLSKDGKCYTWDERANGYCRGEGSGMVMLKKLSEAVADGDHIYAVIEGTGVNQDGQSQGITSPNSDSQEVLINRVLANAELAPQDIDYVEAHGTGTQAGDKAETKALDKVFNKNRDDKLVIGSVKTNIGHLEAAAGMAGLIKSILCLQKAKIPANLHFETPNPDIAFDEMCLEVPTEMREWPRENKKRYVGVNGFGYGGTNAHIVLGQAPETTQASAATCTSLPLNEYILPLSGRSKEAIQALAKQYHDLLSKDNGFTIEEKLKRFSCKRTHYDIRAMVRGKDKAELLSQLTHLAEGNVAEGVMIGDKPCSEKALTFVYSGMGPQWWGMGQALLKTEPLFLAKIKEYDEVFSKIATWSLLEELRSNEAQSKVAQTQYAQPLNFAIQAALTELWMSWGIKPKAVVGHSVGEVTAAYVSGILSLEDALRVSYYRSYYQSTLAHTGGMLAVGLSDKAVAPYLEEYKDCVSIAAVNSPSAVTLAGEQDAIDALEAQLTEDNIFNRVLKVEVPYHSPLMNPIEADIKASLADINPRSANLPCYSTVSGERVGENAFDAEYWWQNVRQSVLFADAIATMIEEGYQDFLEVGPHPVLKNSLLEILGKCKTNGNVFSSLHRKIEEKTALLDALADLYVRGHQPDWQNIYGVDDKWFPLPAYPWQKETYRYGSAKFNQDKFGQGKHPVLYRDLMLPNPSWEVELNDALFPYLKDHKIANQIVLPGAFYVEAALAAGKEIFANGAFKLEKVSFDRILTVPEATSADEKRIMLSYQKQQKTLGIYSTTTSEKETWVPHMQCHLKPSDCQQRSISLPSPDTLNSIDTIEFYDKLAQNGLQYGRDFQAIKSLSSCGELVLADIENTLKGEAYSDYLLPPPVLDAVFQSMFAFAGDFKVPYVPVKISSLELFQKVPDSCRVLGKLLWISSNSLKADFILLDQHDKEVARIEGVVCQALNQMANSDRDEEAGPYQVQWHDLPFEAEDIEASSQHYLVIAADNTLGSALSEQLKDNNNVEYIDAGLLSGNTDELLQRLKADRYDTIIYACDAEEQPMEYTSHAVKHCSYITHLIQSLSECYQEGNTRLLLVTQNASRVLDDDKVGGVASSALVGLCRTINTEYPAIQCSSIDIEKINFDQQVKTLLPFIQDANFSLGEYALRDGYFYTHTLERVERDVEEQHSERSHLGDAVESENIASIDQREFAFKRANLGELDHDALKLEIDYMTLSHWDMRNAQMSLYPDDPATQFFSFASGHQAVAYAIESGEAVANINTGEQVFVLSPMGVKNFCHVPQSHVFKLPQALSHRQLPDVFEIFLARYVLSKLSTLPKQARIVLQGVWSAFSHTLMHELSDLAAEIVFIDEANSQLTELEAKSFSKLHYVSNDESSLQALAQNAYDIYINMGLSDCKALPLLKSFAHCLDFRFAQVEREFSSMANLANCQYTLIDSNQLLMQQYDVVRTHIQTILSDLASNKLPIMAIPGFDLEDLPSAAQQLKDGATACLHLHMKNQSVDLAVALEKPQLALKGSYLISGGTQGFGLQCAQYLADKGAKHLVLLSRRGLRNEDAIAKVEKLKQKGIDVQVHAVDISDMNALEKSFSQIKKNSPPLSGIIHSAMVLDDAYLSQLNEDRYRRVLIPKMQGAINLSKLTENDDLDFFMMFSSISSIIGNAGQGNYVAANSFLDAFAHQLRAQGRNALSINWGALRDSGVLEDNDALVKVLALAGISGVSNKRAMQGLTEAVLANASQEGIFSIDWHKWEKSNPSLSKSKFFSEMHSSDGATEDSEKLMEVLESILNLDSEARHEYVQNELAAKLGAIFKMDPKAINPHTSIIDLGVDSLMSVEISMALRNQLGVDIPSIDLISGPSIAMLADRILEQIEALIDEVIGNEEEDSTEEESRLNEQQNKQLASPNTAVA